MEVRPLAHAPVEPVAPVAPWAACFNSCVAWALFSFAELLGTFRETVRKTSVRAESRQRRHIEKKDIFSGEAVCCVPRRLEGVLCEVRLRSDVLLVKPLDEMANPSAIELDLLGTSVRCQASSVTVHQKEAPLHPPLITLVLEADKLASLWAEKLALACGNTESIAKLLSMQRQRIQSLEQHSQETSLSHDEVERCLNFLSREYVEMRCQVRKTGADSLEEKPEVEAKEREIEAKMQSLQKLPKVEEPHIEGIARRKQHSEPEKEPEKDFESKGRVDPIAEDGTLTLSTRRFPRSPCLLGSPKTKSPKTKETKALRGTPSSTSSATRSQALECLDRRGHKLAMANQRRPNMGKTEGQPTRNSRSHPWQR